MNIRVTLAALMTLGWIGVMVAQSPAPPAAPAPGSAPPQSPATRAPRAAPPAPPARPAPPAPEVSAPPPPPPAPPAPQSPSPRRENQSTNVKVEVTVTDERPGAAPLTKTVGIVTGDGMNGSVRSQTTYQAAGAGPGTAPFNVDAWPVMLADGKVHVRLVVQYDVVPPPGPAGDGLRLMGTSVRDSVSLVLETGKPVVAIQSTDPVSDRKVSVEVKATVLR